MTLVKMKPLLRVDEIASGWRWRIGWTFGWPWTRWGRGGYSTRGRARAAGRRFAANCGFEIQEASE